MHQELAPSNNRVVVTSRPEGVTLSLYSERFVVMNLLELTDEQQRNVIRVQMHGNEFFDHLLAISEVRKGLDAVYTSAFASSALRRRIESASATDELLAADGASFEPSMRQHDASGHRIVAERPPVGASDEYPLGGDTRRSWSSTGQSCTALRARLLR